MINEAKTPWIASLKYIPQLAGGMLVIDNADAYATRNKKVWPLFTYSNYKW